MPDEHTSDTSISVLICTYNRSAQLALTLAALERLCLDGVSAELIIVDNNSTDDTGSVVRRATASLPMPCRYIVERSQGKSFALNAGLAAATGDILALTDDDVWPDEDWLVRIADAFRTGSPVFVFGKVLPRWERPRTADQLARLPSDTWGPLALVDYGDRVIEYEPDIPGLRLPIGANLAVRRAVLTLAAGWRTDLGKVDNSMIQGEDHEIFCRLRELGWFHGIYDPRIVVRHFVPESRTSRRYFWQWFYANGMTAARMADALLAPLQLRDVPLAFGVPRFIYRQCLEQIGLWCLSLTHASKATPIVEELRAVYYVGFIVQCWKWHLFPAAAGRPNWASRTTANP